jgi:hypothetical protein
VLSTAPCTFDNCWKVDSVLCKPCKAERSMSLRAQLQVPMTMQAFLNATCKKARLCVTCFETCNSHSPPRALLKQATATHPLSQAHLLHALYVCLSEPSAKSLTHHVIDLCQIYTPAASTTKPTAHPTCMPTVPTLANPQRLLRQRLPHKNMLGPQKAGQAQ